MTVTARKTKWILIIGLAAVGVTVLLAVMFGLLAGGFGPSQPALVFSSAAEEFVYDGQEHIGSKWELSSGRLKEGETVVVRFAEGRTQAGVYENSFTATVLDENGSDVSESYHISYKFGAFTILPREIGIATADAEKEYDGTPLTNGSYEMTSGTLLAGHTLHVKMTGSRTLVGSISNSVEITVSDAEGRDVTKNYRLSDRRDGHDLFGYEGVRRRTARLSRMEDYFFGTYGRGHPVRRYARRADGGGAM